MRFALAPALLASVALSPPPPSLAQDLASGTWTGMMNLATGPELAVEFVVSSNNGDFTVTMNVVDGPPSQVTDLRVEGEELHFRWGAFECTLEREHDSEWNGTCSGADDATLTLEAPRRGETAGDVAEDPGDVLRTADLLGTRASNVYEALQRLRPQWLRARGGARIGRTAAVRVVMDKQRVGGIEFLKSLEPDAVAEIRYYTASDASMIFGGDVEGGVLAVTRRR